jgi:hypothetical protein
MCEQTSADVMPFSVVLDFSPLNTLDNFSAHFCIPFEKVKEKCLYTDPILNSRIT